jgi:hypothetical protein
MDHTSRIVLRIHGDYTAVPLELPRSPAIVVAMETIAWQAVKAAQTDPVETIRYE